MNEGYIDNIESELDRREKIFYPIVMADDDDYDTHSSAAETNRNKRLGVFLPNAQFNTRDKIHVENSTLYPDKQYLISEIQALLRYAEQKALFSQIKIKNHEEQEITVEDLVDRYYNNPENYFQFDSKKDSDNGNGNGNDRSSTSADLDTQEQENNILEKNPIVADYLQNGEIASESQGKPKYPTKIEVERLGLKAQGKSWEI